MARKDSHHKNIITTIALMAMGLSFLAQITPLWLSQTNGTSLVICTAFGIKTIVIDENGDSIPTKQEKTKNHCTMCLNASLDTNILPAYTYRTTRQTTYKLHWKIYTTPNDTSSINAQHAIRAPPHLS